MAISLIATASTDAASGNINFTHGLTIASGDVVIAFINVNGTGNTAADNNGSTPFTETTHGDQPPAGSAVMYIFERVCGASEPSAYAFTLGSSDRSSIVLRQYRGVDSTVWDVAPSGSNISTDDSGGTTSTCSAITIATSGACGIVAMGDDFNPTTTTYSSINNSYGNVQSESGQQYQVTADKLGLSTGSTGTTVITSGATVRTVQWQMALKPSAGVTLEQEGFRFGVDDGNEASHSWEAAQDTNISTADTTTKLIRLLANATGDPAAIAYKLKYQKNGSGGYATVPLVASSKTKPVIEAADCTVSGSNTAAASWAVSHPAASTGDLLIFYIAWDDSTTTTGVTAPSGANGETLTAINATPITDSSTETRAKAWYCVATGSWTATTKTFTPSATESWSATVVRVPAGEFDATTPIGTTATRASTAVTDTNVLSASMTAGASDGGGALLWFAGVDTDPLGGTNPTGWTILQSQDLGAVAHGVAVRNTEVSNSESIAGGDTWAIAGDSWTSIGVIVRAPTVTNDLYISASANITAGGEATTARLTAPSGKTTSDFVTGRRWDDENGTDTTNITTDDYSEFEFPVTLRSGLTGGDYFDFRLYNSDTPFDTYTNTPRWTITSSITGIGLATQASDVPTSTATLKLAAVVNQTQANNASTATGTLDIVGILTQTQASDSIVATGTGTTTTTGTGLITQADNTIASTATLKIQAVANQTQASNVIASTGALSLAANVTQSQADNTATSTAALSIKATATQAQADNTVSSTAALGIKASTNQVQADNTADATGKLSIVANVSQSQADNVSTATGALYIYANTTATQDSNTITAAGAGTPSTNGVVSATQDNNAISASATLDIAANGLVTQADNAPSITATLKLFGAVGITADDNTTIATGALSIQGAVNVSQGDNVLVAYNVTPVPDRDVTPNLAYYKAVRAEQKRDLAMYMDRYYG